MRFMTPGEFVVSTTQALPILDTHAEAMYV